MGALLMMPVLLRIDCVGLVVKGIMVGAIRTGQTSRVESVTHLS